MLLLLIFPVYISQDIEYDKQKGGIAVKIRCEYCGSMMNDTEEACPSCGAPNRNVRRSSGDQPLTIAELKRWYESKGLPPENVTRFFIGKNVREPRAFGIYFDENTGNFVVYKNKDSGARAVRYEGTDEAYAVNELFQRLKQEITQQKMLNAKRQKAGAAEPAGKKPGCLGQLLALLLAGVGTLVLAGVLMTAFGLFLTRNDPPGGYYTYGNTSYYYSTRDYSGLNWFRCTDGSDWEGPLALSEVPDELETKKQSKPYYLQENWTEDLPCGDFSASVYAKDLELDARTEEGYYRLGSAYFYHLTGCYDDDWYTYGDDGWQSVEYDALPEDLQRPSAARDFYYTPTWDSETQITDFADSDIYQEISQTEQTRENSYSDSDSDSDFDWDSGDSWDSADTDWDSDW